jgi:hypothetical protein
MIRAASVSPSDFSGVSGAASPSGLSIEKGVSETSRRRARAITLWALLASVVISVPGLFAGFSNDDLSHRLELEGAVPWYTGGVFGLYDFTPPGMQAPAFIEQGVFPWFSDPELSLRFFRPLSSLSLWLDHALFGRNALLAHLQSMVWMLVLVSTASSLYRRWFSAPAALFASLIFALAGVHAMPMAWLAARNGMIAATFGLASLWAWVRFREDGYKPGAPLSLLLLVASLGSNESGLVAALLLAGYELGTRGFRRGSGAALLPLGLGLVYLGLYAAFGYGSRASGFYISPFDAPLEYAAAVFFGAPTLLAELLLGLPSIVAGMFGRPGQLVFLVLAAAALGSALLLFRALGSVISAPARRTLAWLSLTSALSLAALCGVLVSGRVLPMPLFAAAAVGGNALWGCWVLARGSAEPAGRARRRWWVPVLLVSLFQLVVPMFVRLAMPLDMGRAGREQERLAQEANLGACAAGGSLYLVNGSDPTLTLYAGAALLFYTPDKARFERLRVLSMAPQAQLLTRTAPDAVRLDVLDLPRQSNAFEWLFRAPGRPLLPGLSLSLGELTVDVDAVNEEGLFTGARFNFTGGLDGPSRCLLVWRDGRLESVPWPALGESLRVEHAAGPMGL